MILAAGVAGVILLALLVWAVIHTANKSTPPPGAAARVDARLARRCRDDDRNVDLQPVPDDDADQRGAHLIRVGP